MLYLELKEDIGDYGHILGSGTCRLRDLIAPRAKDGFGRLSSTSGFCHTLEDTLQQIKVLTGESKIPRYLWPLVFGEGADENIAKMSGVSAARPIVEKNGLALVIEWSSVIRHRVDGFDINPSYLGTQIVRRGGPKWLDWWTSVSNGGVVSQKDAEDLANNPGNIDMNFFSKEDLERIALGLEITRTRGCKDIISEILNYSQASRLILLVPYRSRGVVISIQEEGLEELDMDIIYMGSLVEKIGIESLFKSGGKDLSHFEPGIEDTASSLFFDDLSELLVPQNSDASDTVTSNIFEFFSPMRILLVGDSRMLTRPLLRDSIDSWHTVNGFQISKWLQELGHSVEIEKMEAFIDEEKLHINENDLFDFALIVHNYPSERPGEPLFSNIRKHLPENGLICSICDDDANILYEDFRFFSTRKNPGSNEGRKKQIFWGSDPELYYPDKDQNKVRILLDVWYYLEREWDITKEIFDSCKEYVLSGEFQKTHGKDIELVAWGEFGAFTVSKENPDGRLVNRPPRIPTEDFVSEFKKADIFVVTHSESLGLSVLDAGMAGCKIIVPVADRGYGRRFIQPDLLSTVPHVKFDFGDGPLEIPWGDFVEIENVNEIRKECLGLTWESVSRTIAATIGKKIGAARVISEPDEETNPHREWMLTTLKLMGDQSFETASEFVFHWISDNNFDEVSKKILNRMIRESGFDSGDLDSAELLDSVFFRYMEDIVKSGGMETQMRFLQPFFGDFSYSILISMLVRNPKSLIETRIHPKLTIPTHSKEDIVGFIRTTNIAESIIPALLTLENENLKGWSMGRILQTHFNEEFDMMADILKMIPEDIDTWKVLIRSLWSNQRRPRAVSVARDALNYHPGDEWIQSLSTREVD